jgi:diketogulonate reductase-like aldo/keto reductase
MTNETIYQFAMKAMSTNTFEEAKNLVTDIILAVNMDASLIDEAVKYVNEEFMKAALNNEASNQSELN